jgi:cobalt/nickel transport system ATP-binding protein
MNQVVLELDNIAVRHYSGSVFQKLSLVLKSGDRLALLGSNGSGKTTLLQTIVGLNKLESGNLVVFGRECQDESDFIEVRKRVGLLFQDSDDQLFCPTVLEDVAFGPMNLGLNAHEAKEKALNTLKKLELESLSERITHQLSGGQKRLVALATVLAMEPEILLLDEPTNALDDQSKERLLVLLQSLDQAMVIVSHDQAVIDRLANRAVIMKNGSLVDGVIHRHPHRHEHSHLHVHEKSEIKHHDVLKHDDHYLDKVED